MAISLDNIHQLREVARIRRGWMRDVVWSPNGRVLAAASAESISFHSIDALQIVGKLDGHDGPVKGVAVNPDGTLIASAGADTTVRLWDLRAGGRQQILQGHQDAVNGVAFDAAGHKVASASADKTVRVWDVANARQLKVLQGHTDEITSAVYGANNILATGGWDSTIRLWDSEGTCQQILYHENWIRHLTVSADGTILASASRDGTVRLWDMTTGSELMRLDAHAGGADSVAFANGETLLATSGRDLSMKFWNMSSGALIHTLMEHDKPVLTMEFSGDDSMLATGSGDNTLRLWRIV